MPSSKRHASKNDGRSTVLKLTGIGFAISLIMAVGPGAMLVNRPETIVGIPLLYAWAVFWYAIICCIALVADRWVWSKDLCADDS